MKILCSCEPCLRTGIPAARLITASQIILMTVAAHSPLTKGAWLSDIEKEKENIIYHLGPQVDDVSVTSAANVRGR